MTDNDLQLWLLAVGPQTQTAEGPPLRRGVHLRWAPSPTRGFPWGGYYLLRRSVFGTDAPPASGFGYQSPWLPDHLALDPPTATPSWPDGSVRARRGGGTWQQPTDPATSRSERNSQAHSSTREAEREREAREQREKELRERERWLQEAAARKAGGGAANNAGADDRGSDSSSDSVSGADGNSGVGTGSAGNGGQSTGSSASGGAKSQNSQAKSKSYGAWHPVPVFPANRIHQPIALPVEHPDYPPFAKLGAAVGPIPGLMRIERTAGDWRERQMQELVANSDNFIPMLEQLVAGGPDSLPMVQRSWLPASDSTSVDAPDSEAVTVEPQSLFETVLAPIAFPSFAQFLGLYALDEFGGIGSEVEYWLLADYENVFGCDLAAVLAWANSKSSNKPKIKSGVGEATWSGTIQNWAQPLAQPGYLFGYNLPAVRIPASDGLPTSFSLASASVGLLWKAPSTASDTLPGATLPEPVLYSVRRADLGEPTQADWDAPYSSTSASKNAKWLPVPDTEDWCLATGQVSFAGAEALAAWDGQGAMPLDQRLPPVDLHFVDIHADERWYAYRVQALDWFGRVGAWSDMATWKTWTWMGTPGQEPWYFAKADKYRVVNKGKILAINADAPQGPAFEVAKTNLLPSGDVALHLNWAWSADDVVRAPLYFGFRVYVRPGRSNVYRGTLESAKYAAVTGQQVELECTLLAGNVDLTKATKCTLRVGTLGLTIDEVKAGEFGPVLVCTLPSSKTPANLPPKSPCTLVVPEGHGLWQQSTDIRQPVWQRLAHVLLHQHQQFEVARANTPLPLTGALLSVGEHWRVALPGSQPLGDAGKAESASELLVYVSHNGKTEAWLGQIAACDTSDRVVDAVLRPLTEAPAMPPGSWAVGRWQGGTWQTHQVALPDNSAKKEPLQGTGSTAEALGVVAWLGGVVPITGVQPDQQLLLLQGVTGQKAWTQPLTMFSCNPVTRLANLTKPDGSTSPIEQDLTVSGLTVQPNATWTIGRVGTTGLTADAAFVDQPLTGPVDAAGNGVLVLGGPAPLAAYGHGPGYVLLAPANADGSPDLTKSTSQPFVSLDPATRTVQLAKDAAAGDPAATSGVQWYLGVPTYGFSPQVIVPAALAKSGSDGNHIDLEVAVTAVANRPYIPDWLVSASGPTKYGCEGQPAYFRSCRIAEPQQPIVLPTQPKYEYRLATAPDIDGKSYITLRWPKEVGGVAVPAVRILRANANAVALAMTTPVAGVVVKTEDVIKDWLAKKIEEQFGDAAEAQTQRCYAPVTAAPLVTAALLEISGPNDPPGLQPPINEATFIDTLDGQVPSRWFYRIEPIDAQGAPAALGAVIGILVQGIDRPAAPVLLDAYFGTEAEHEQFIAAKSAEALLEVLAGIKERTISLVWRHANPEGMQWVIDVGREDGMFRESKVFPPFPGVAANKKMKVNFPVPTAGRWRVEVRAVNLGNVAVSGKTPCLWVGVCN